MLKEGTKVFDIQEQQWGTVHPNPMSNNYPIKVVFKHGTLTYTEDGKLSETDKLPVLSLTEFNYLAGEGVFTPIDSEPPIKEGDRVWAWNEDNGPVVFGYLEYPLIEGEVTTKIEGMGWFRFSSPNKPVWVD